MDICGFMLVRKPKENYDPIGKGIWPNQAPHIGGIYYGGSWRMPWFDVELERRMGNLSGDLQDLYLANVTDIQGSSFALCTILEIAEQLLEYCNRDHPKCELLAIYSPTLASMKGTISISDPAVEHRGWEPFQIGGGSLLIDGVFAVPHRFPAWQAKLNNKGLLTSVEESLQYISAYKQLAGIGLLEELFPEEEYPVEPIKILSMRI